MMWNIAKYEISHHDPVYSKKVNYIKQMMLQILAAMLSKAASEIDVCKPLTEDNDGLDESSDVMISNEEDDESTDAIISDEDDEPTIVISDDEEEIVNWFCTKLFYKKYNVHFRTRSLWLLVKILYC